MTRVSAIGVVIISGLTLLLPRSVEAQPSSGAQASVPRIMQFSGTFHPSNGQPPAPVEIVTFAIYADETGGTPLWQETQNVTIASLGDYTVTLGSTNPDGLPMDVFASGQANWLGVHVERSNESDQPRIRIMSVPYALRSADADTLGGKPASAYLLAEPATSASTASSGKSASVKANGFTTQSASTGWIPVATDSIGGLGNSVLFQSASNFIGVGTTTPNDAVHAVINDPNGNFTGYAVQNLSPGAFAYSGMLFYDHTGALRHFQGYNNSTHEYRINNIAPGGTINFMIGSNSKFLVANNGDIDISRNITRSGTLFVHTTEPSSTFLGLNAGNTMTSGCCNSAFGDRALQSNTSGFGNVAMGMQALSKNTAGLANVAIGSGALANNTIDRDSVAVGENALGNYTGNTAGCCGGGNSALGSNALAQDTIGMTNTAVGEIALINNTIGFSNVAVGAGAGQNATTGSNNIYLGTDVRGVAGESNTMYLGKVGTQTTTLIAGVRGTTTGAADGVAVVIDSNGQLGTINSSRRYKDDIQDMGDASSGLMRLRPVTYRYKQAYANGTKPIDYGLIAEEVEQVYPDLVAHLAGGEVETVQYQKINAMLLNEVQKQHAEIAALKARLDALERERR